MATRAEIETSTVKAAANMSEIRCSEGAKLLHRRSNMPSTRSRKRSLGETKAPVEKSMVRGALALHLVLSACSSAAAAAAPRDSSACFVSSHAIGPLHSRSSFRTDQIRERHAQGVLHTAGSQSALRCPPISSTLSPHSLHSPTPMHSTKENVHVPLDQVREKNTKNGGSGSGNANGDDDWFGRTSDPRGAHAELSVPKLQALTNKHLKRKRNLGQLKGSEIHELTVLLSSWSKRSVAESGPLAEAILDRIIAERSAGNVRAVPTASMLNTALNAWAKSGVNDGAQRSMKLLDRMDECRLQDESYPLPDTQCFFTVMSSFAKRKDYQAAQTAEKLLVRLGDFPGNERQAKHFNVVLNAYAESGHSRSGEMAERLLESMAELYRTTGDDNVKPELQSFNTVIKAHARSKRKDSAQQAAGILSSMQTEPDKITYSSCIDAWSKSGAKGAADKAEGILKEMKALSQNGHLDCKPDRICYNAVINALATSSEQDAGERSERLLDEMQKLCDAGDEEMQPDTWTYNTCIKAYANSSGRGAARKGLRLLKKMESIHIAGNPNVTPDVYSYNSCMNGFAKSREGGSAQMAEELLERMESLSPAGRYIKNVRNVPPQALRNVQPDKISFNTAIYSWANSNDMLAAARADGIFQRMLAAYKTGDDALKPDVTTYNSLLTAWSRTPSPGAAEKAEEILEHMFELSEAGNRDCRPDRQSFTSVINAWAKSRNPSKAQNAQRLLRRMNSLAESGNDSLRPNIFIYGAVLNACAFTYGKKAVKERALAIAIETFKELNRLPDVQNNDVTYATFLRAVSTLAEKNDPRRDHLIEHVFRQCCKDGQVSASVLKQLSKGAPHLYISLLPSAFGKKAVYGMIGMDEIPQKWKRNVRQGKNFRLLAKSTKWKDGFRR